jgi:hypothetical protein
MLHMSSEAMINIFHQAVVQPFWFCDNWVYRTCGAMPRAI